MPADVHNKVYLLPKFSPRIYNFLVKSLNNTLTFDSSDIARYRHHALVFFYKHGWKSTYDAFGIKKSTLYDWKKEYGESGKRLSSLVPVSTRPHNTRAMATDVRLIEFIRVIREEYGNVGKVKLKLFLDEYAASENIPSLGLTTIGKVIKRKRYFFQRNKVKRRRKLLSPRIRYAPKETLPGYLEMDSIILYVTSKRYYFVTCIDVVSRFAFCALVPALSAKHTKEVFKTFLASYPYAVRAIQTDNGHEFMGEFDRFLEEAKIKHEWLYPKSPKVNGVAERFNRTVQEEFIQRSDHLLCDLPAFKEKLTKYLAYYNQKRPHHSLRLLTPMQFLQQYSQSPESM